MKNWISFPFSILFIFFTLPSISLAIDEGDLRLGVMGGNVALLGDAGSGGRNAIGFGGSFGYLFSGDLGLDISFVSSSHKAIDHSKVSAGVDYYTGGDGTVLFYVSGGVGLISNSVTNSNIDGQSMSLYIGGGADFEIRRNLLFGGVLKYHKAFEASENVSGVNIKTVEDVIDVMVKVAFVLPGGDNW